MKNILSGCLLLSLFACNNQTGNTNEKENPVAAPAEKAAATGNCGSLVLFHKGAVIEGTSYDAAGKETSKQTTTITDVANEGGMLVANSSSARNGTANQHVMKLTYKCDGTNLYLDMASMMQNFSGMGNMKADAKPMSFPINISVGETLPDASYTVSVDRGAVKMDITSTLSNRMVSARENITTTAGSWDCYKINTDIKSDVQGLDERTKKIMDAVNEKMKMSMLMWYTPKAGIVRTEMYQNGKLNSRSDVTSIKE